MDEMIQASKKRVQDRRAEHDRLFSAVQKNPALEDAVKEAHLSLMSAVEELEFRESGISWDEFNQRKQVEWEREMGYLD